MKRLTIAAATTLLLSPMAFGQSTAAIDIGSVDAVVKQCEIVANSTPDGSCVGATGDFLTLVKVTQPASIDDNVIALVVAIAPLAARDARCDALDDEIAEAIRLASTFATDPAQIARLIEIADTVAACQGLETAALRGAPLGISPDE